MADIYAISIENADGTPSYADEDMHTIHVECEYDSEATNIAGHILRGRIMAEVRSLTGRNLPEPDPQAIANRFRVRVELLSPKSDPHGKVQATKFIGSGYVTINGAVVRRLNRSRTIRNDQTAKERWAEDQRKRMADPSTPRRNVVVWHKPMKRQSIVQRMGPPSQ